MKKTKKSRLARAIAVGLSAAMMSALALVGVAPAVAAPGAYTVSGMLNTPDGVGVMALPGVRASITIPDPGFSDTVLSGTSASDGAFSLVGVPNGSHTISFTLDGYVPKSVAITVADFDFMIDGPVTMIPLPEALAVGTVAITGTPVVGNVLTAVTNGWPVGATLKYEWFYSCGQCGGAVDGEVASSYTVTSDVVSYWLGVIVTGSKAGYSDASVRVLLETVTSAPKKAAAPAPSDLAAYLQAHGSTPQAQTSTGLPAGALNPGAAQTANLQWSSPDSFVDVYVFSTPTFVGTFPVVNGVAQIWLSAAVLAQLASGGHTMVVTGQSSGAVMSVAMSIGLPVTGVDVTLPLTMGSLLVLLGASLVVARRRFAAKA